MPRKKKKLLPPPPAVNEKPSPLHYVIKWNQKSYLDDGFRKFLRRMIDKEEADLVALEKDYNDRREKMVKRSQWVRDRVDQIWKQIEEPLLSGTVEDDLWNEYRELINELCESDYLTDPFLIRSRELSQARLFLCHMDTVDATTAFYKCMEKMGQNKEISQSLREIPWVSLS